MAVTGKTRVRSANLSIYYALVGVFLGLMAPFGWLLLRPMIFVDPQLGYFERLHQGAVAGGVESLAIFLYMSFGSALVLGGFGFAIGRASRQVYERAQSLDELSSSMTRQKEEFERRFEELRASLRSFHEVNARIQKAVRFEDVLALTSEGLNRTLGYDRVNILMLNDERNALRWVEARRGEHSEDVSKLMPVALDSRAGALFRAFSEKRIVHVAEARSMPAEYRLQAPFNELSQLRSQSFIICPVLVNDEVCGLFGIDNKLSGRGLDETDVDTIKLFADQVSSALTKISLLDAVEALVRELNHTFDELGKYREDFSSLIANLKRATASTASSIADIASSSDVVRDTVSNTQASATEISTSIEEVSQNMRQLSSFMENSIAAMTQISTTIKEVEESGALSQNMSETVKEQADAGVHSVSATMEGMRGISQAVREASEVIEQLSHKGEEIDTITTVINEVTQKTNLLALNAAIIAAQAGEQGRSFGVVAEEIRGLSQETATSTEAIAQIISEIQALTRQAVGHIGKTRDWMSKGLNLGRGTERSLREILDSAIRAQEMARKIRGATKEVANSAEYVSQSIEELGGMASQVSSAFREQVQGTQNIVRSIEQVFKMTDDMVVATTKQEHDTRDIEIGVERVQDMAGNIFREMARRQVQSREVVVQLERLKQKRMDGGAA